MTSLPRIRFGSILLLFVYGTVASIVVYIGCRPFHVSEFTTLMVVTGGGDIGWIAAYAWMSDAREWINLPKRFEPVRGWVLPASAVLAVASVCLDWGVGEILTRAGVKLANIPDDFSFSAAELPQAFGVIGLVAPFAEELLFRGLLLDWLRQRLSVWPSMLILSLVFTLFHNNHLLSGAIGWVAFGGRFCLGMAAALLTVRYKSLRPAFVLHATFNSILVCLGALNTP
jgi:membrane protease YdiL (CAAX protease family)